jgi:hypothetical protein
VRGFIPTTRQQRRATVPKVNIEAEFSLTTEIEPDFYGHDFEGTDVADSSSFGTAYVDVDGGSLTFTVEANDEDDAEREAQEVVFDGMEMIDQHGFTWAVTNTSFSVEAVELSLSEAIAAVREWLRTAEIYPPNIREAFDVILVNLDER